MYLNIHRILPNKILCILDNYLWWNDIKFFHILYRWNFMYLYIILSHVDIYKIIFAE